MGPPARRARGLRPRRGDALCIGGSGTIDGLWRGGRVANVAGPGGAGRGTGQGGDGDAGAAAGDPRGGNAGNPGSAAGGPDIAAINELLTGEQSIRNTLATARDDVVDLIERSGVFEFVPLLQALDLRRNPGCACIADDCDRMRVLPAEDADDHAGRDAALATLLCLSALTDQDIRHDSPRTSWMRWGGSPTTARR
nr:hypothetical protein [Corynebacterium xerosis]